MTALAVEHMLDDLGLPEHAKVGLLARNIPAHYAAVWGLFLSARCISMVHAFQPPVALIEDMISNRWPIVLADGRDWSPEIVNVANSIGAVGYRLTGDARQPLECVTARRTSGETDKSANGELVVELLSSGTTGRPKRLPLDRKAVDEMIARTVYQFRLGGAAERSTQVTIWPLSALGGFNGALPAAVLGQQIATQERFNAPRMLELIRRHRPPFLALPPSALGMILQLNPRSDDFSSVKLYSSGASPLDPNVQRRFEDEYGVPVTIAYGATEFCGIISGWTAAELPLRSAKRLSAGRALPGIRIRIVSPETNLPLPPGEIGLIEALVPRVGDEWARTNDLGYLDEEGFLYLEGRADDTIIRGGFKIAPEEVADVLRTHPLVGDAALIGLKDDRVGMVPAAAIQKRPGHPAPSVEELEAFLRDRLPAYKIPVQFAIVDEIPRTETMKPRRAGLRALFGAEL